jgi:cyclic-di-GMP-binding protein
MASFDVVSEVDMQEVRNAVDQAERELSQRFDFKGTNSSIELREKDNEIEMKSVSQDRINAVRQVLEEKWTKRKLSLKAIDHGKVEDAAGGTARQVSKLQAGISSDKAKLINKFVKEHGPKGMQSQTQGEQVRITSKKRDDLQAIMAALKEEDFGIPLQFENFRD